MLLPDGQISSHTLPIVTLPARSSPALLKQKQQQMKVPLCYHIHRPEGRQDCSIDLAVEDDPDQQEETPPQDSRLSPTVGQGHLQL